MVLSSTELLNNLMVILSVNEVSISVGGYFIWIKNDFWKALISLWSSRWKWALYGVLYLRGALLVWAKFLRQQTDKSPLLE